MFVKLAGRRWQRKSMEALAQDGEACNGLTDYEKRIIFIEEQQQPKRLLDTEIHEAFHALFRWMDEGYVKTAASDLTNYLWRLGYRKCE